MLNCPICKSSNIDLFIKREQIPANQNLLVASEQLAKKVPRGTLALQKCLSCGFVFNTEFDLSLLHYGEDYDNTQNLSTAFQKHLDLLVEDLLMGKKIQNHRIIEIGCGKGTFLESLVVHPFSRNEGIGFDPSYLGELNRLGGRLKFVKTFYDRNSSHIQADVVICRHVIEHISQPVELLKVIRDALINSPNARLFFETPCLEWILQNKAIWDFFYEHCSYYTKDSLSLAFQEAGFKVESVKHVFAGQYLWLEASVGGSESATKVNPSLFELIDQYTASEKEMTRFWKEEIRKHLSKGKLAIWGAGAKGVTFANLFDPKRELFDCIIDVNTKKQNHFLPGTGHPIVGVHELKNRGIKTAILMNPNYEVENKALLKEQSIHTNLVVI